MLDTVCARAGLAFPRGERRTRGAERAAFVAVEGDVGFVGGGEGGREGEGTWGTPPFIAAAAVPFVETAGATESYVFSTGEMVRGLCGGDGRSVQRCRGKKTVCWPG